MHAKGTQAMILVMIFVMMFVIFLVILHEENFADAPPTADICFQVALEILR